MAGNKGGCMVGCGVLVIIGMIGSSIDSCKREGKHQEDLAAKIKQESEEKRKTDEAAEQFKQLSTEDHVLAIEKAIKLDDFDLASRHLAQIPNNYSKKNLYIEKIKIGTVNKLKKELKQQEINAIENRKAFANRLEQSYLDNRLNIDVNAVGSKADVLKIKWVLTSKVAANELSKGDVLISAKSLGFKKVILTNGFESSLGETWTWDLSK